MLLFWFFVNAGGLCRSASSKCALLEITSDTRVDLLRHLDAPSILILAATCKQLYMETHDYALWAGTLIDQLRPKQVLVMMGSVVTVLTSRIV